MPRLTFTLTVEFDQAPARAIVATHPGVIEADAVDWLCEQLGDAALVAGATGVSVVCTTSRPPVTFRFRWAGWPAGAAPRQE